MPEKSRGTEQAALFGNQAIDQALCGIGAGCVSVLCMHPLDLLKVKFQVSNKNADLIPNNRFGGGGRIVHNLKNIVREDGWRGLYRGLSPNMVGNASSWGFYFLWYSMIKKKMSTNADGSETGVKLSASQHLFASASSGVITAMITNPLWVVKTRMFTTRKTTAGAYRSVFGTHDPYYFTDGLYRIATEEGPRGLWKGSVLALVGVSNGAIQFMTYEELKKWRQEIGLKKRLSISGSNRDEAEFNLSNLEYIILSGAAKLLAIGITYPYQVVRSRLQSQAFIQGPHPASQTNLLTVHYRSIPHCITHTYQNEGFKAFYKGLGTNAVRVLPGTCVTFVVYENLSRWMRDMAKKRSI